MDSYLDITLKPDAEMPLNWLLNIVYTKLHKALWESESTETGVSFPEYRHTLGRVLRLHSNGALLEGFADKVWLGGMSEYCLFSEVLRVPEGVKYRCIYRQQPNMSTAKLNRLRQRGSITPDNTKSYRAKMCANGFEGPYVELVSASNGNKHRRYIAMGELQNEPRPGVFDSFGLSKTASVPWF